ncbi:MAG: ABC transporter ATP-binding protein [Thermotogota bacterium]
MIQVQGLYKSFKNKRKKVEVLKDINFTAEPGKIFGLLGPNGAGKTTTLRTIATLLKPDKGQITVDGLDVQKKPRKVRDKIGFLTSDMKLSGNLSPRELLKFFGELNHIDSASIKKRTEELTEYLDMASYLDKPVEKLSTGMKQKASLAVSLIHDPEIIIFDEPTNGLDILAAKVVVDFIYDSKKAGKTVVLSTHIMSEAEKLCDDIGIILEGELEEQGNMKEIMEKYNTNKLEDVFFNIASKKGVVENV